MTSCNRFFIIIIRCLVLMNKSYNLPQEELLTYFDPIDLSIYIYTCIIYIVLSRQSRQSGKTIFYIIKYISEIPVHCCVELSNEKEPGYKANTRHGKQDCRLVRAGSSGHPNT